MRFYVSQRVAQTIVYLVEDADSEEDAIARVGGGQVPVDHEHSGHIEWTVAKKAEPANAP